ncbi:hypothetical protein NQ176_g1104 [Zarea fungicola]|uniref:Uncharacterized protein n=1 Tax=Zarea fungicola TaxID=93591 RepID=A0ACC1NU73_9HYPO|nr:hypothetical protein NQ176_g1104 [Lecanicillium fungicola]
MSCHVCLRGHEPQKLPFLCPVDARNQIYNDRVKNLLLLFENEQLRLQINCLLDGCNAVEAGTAAQILADDSTKHILASAKKLRQEIKEAREDIRQRKASIATRRTQLAAALHGSSDVKLKQQRDVEKSTQVLNFRWSQSAEDMASTRAFLCREAVKLYGLKRVRKGNSGRYEYFLGRLPIVDLSSLECESTLVAANSTSQIKLTCIYLAQTPEAISTSLAHLSHILMLIAHYLAVRLPAEITLPHRDYPRPTIFNLMGSYNHEHASFQGSPGAGIIPNEINATRAEHLPTPRPLYIDKPIRQFAKENSAGFSFFLEGVTLLAYNIAWLSSSQGVSIGEGSFDDICNMGKNLYSLLVSSCLQGPLLTNAASDENKNTVNKDDITPSWIGRYSHGTTFYALGGADGSDLVRTFRLPSPMKLADKLKKKILGETPAPDWELLEDDAWKVDDEPETRNGKEVERPKAESKGWMKVKSR